MSSTRRDFSVPKKDEEGNIVGRTFGAKTHSYNELLRIEESTGLVFCGWVELDVFMCVPVFARKDKSNDPEELAKVLQRARGLEARGTTYGIKQLTAN